jgi:hypothetical protein
LLPAWNPAKTAGAFVGVKPAAKAQPDATAAPVVKSRRFGESDLLAASLTATLDPITFDRRG